MVCGEKRKMKLTWRIWLLIIALVLSILLIFNIQGFTSDGVYAKHIDNNSTAYTSGLKQGEIITAVNGNKIANVEEYSQQINFLFKTQNTSQKIVLDTLENQYVFFSDSVPKISVENIPKTRLKAGLDLQGGSRALVEPEQKLTESEMQTLIDITNNRFNVYGISDVSIRPVSDLSGNQFMLVEMGGTSPSELESLVSQQGKFEAKIGEKQVFTGGINNETRKKDITYVCRGDAQCSGITSCNQDVSDTWFCNYYFVIHLSEQAAQRHADITAVMGINSSQPQYLEKQIDFFVDDNPTTSLFISRDLQGEKTTQIQIQGSGSGPDRESAFNSAENSMRQLQTILVTGSLPYKLEIVKLDRISPVLGSQFTSLILLTAVVTLGAVSLIIFIRYRNFKAALALIFTSFSEIIMILGFASLIKWNLDLPSIVGILVTIGTGVDQQIVILDESSSKRSLSLKEKLKKALFIVVASYLTTAFALLPLWWAGAGLLKGFMVTTLIGLTIGVLISRPAFADMIKKIGE